MERKISSPSLLEQLLKALQALPGIGPKSAQRIAFSLLSRKRPAGRHLATVLEQAMVTIGHCLQCRAFCETEVCRICADGRRSAEMLCVVEMPSDLNAIESLDQFFGRYFVLLGRLSPIEGIMPKDLGLDQFDRLLATKPPKEVIIATNPTVEGDITAQYIGALCHRHQVSCNRIAHGIPVGFEIEYLDKLTLSYALSGRTPFQAQMIAFDSTLPLPLRSTE